MAHPSPTPSHETASTFLTSQSLATASHTSQSLSTSSPHFTTASTATSPTSQKEDSALRHREIAYQDSNSHEDVVSNRLILPTLLSSEKAMVTTTVSDSKCRKFVCSTPGCGKRFSKKWNMQAHERLHTGSTPFSCRLGCGASYMWMSSRKGHELNRCRFSSTVPPALNPSRMAPTRRKRSFKRIVNQASSSKRPSAIPSSSLRSIRTTSRNCFDLPTFSSALQRNNYCKDFCFDYCDSNINQPNRSDATIDFVKLKVPKTDYVTFVSEDLLECENMSRLRQAVPEADDVLRDVRFPDRISFSETFLQRIVLSHDADRLVV